MFKKKKSDTKKSLEKKLYLARERPDEIFDLSSCELKTIPQGIFSIVKVLLKTEMYLQENMLQNLDSGGRLSDLQNIVILDLSFNSFKHLPDEIDALQSLEILKVAHNNLECLSPKLMNLRKLKLIDVQVNYLKEISPDIKNLENLQDFYVDENPLESLPRTLCRLRKLNRLTVPLKSIKYPPKDICSLGTSKIMEFLCKEEGITYTPRDDKHTEKIDTQREQRLPGKHNEVIDYNPPSYNSLLGTYERKNEERRMRALELERQSLENQWAQKELVSKAEQTKAVLNKLSEEESKTDADLVALQQKRDQERSALLCSLINVEDHAANLIKHLLSINESLKYHESAENKAFQDQLSHRNDSFQLRREEVLESMHSMLSTTDKAYESHKSKIEAIKEQALSEQDLDEFCIQQALANRRHDSSKLYSELALEESIQKEAFANLQNQRDMQAQRVQHQIGLIEQELCRLTLAEQARKAKRSQINQQVLAERRTELLRLLTQLLDEREKRQSELILRLQEMEERKSEDQKDFWLVQYQRLLDTKPVQLLEKVSATEIQNHWKRNYRDIIPSTYKLVTQSNNDQPKVHTCELDPDILDVLEKANCRDLLPYFQRHHISYSILRNMSDDELKQIGVHSLGQRRSIFQVISSNSVMKHEIETTRPSAPTEPVPSAPPHEIMARIENECCICQDAQCTVIFLQCGHVCSCTKCSESVSTCPLCRSSIFGRIQLQY